MEKGALRLASWLLALNVFVLALLVTLAVLVSHEIYSGAATVVLAVIASLLFVSFQMLRGRRKLEDLRHELINRELLHAREIQLAWLPERQGTQVSCDVAALNHPASHVSGDFYNWFELADGRVVVVIGDVTGHGLPAAFLMATTQLLVRMTMERLGDPGAAMREVNRPLCAHVFSGQFVTMLIMVVDARNGVAEIATAGHPPPLVGSGLEFAPLPVEPQLVLAIEPDVEYRTQRMNLPAGASVLLYTDGVTDLQCPGGDRLCIEGLCQSLYGRFKDARALVDSAMDAVEAYRGVREPADDLTLVAIHLAPDSAELIPPATSEAPAHLDSPVSADKV